MITQCVKSVKSVNDSDDDGDCDHGDTAHHIDDDRTNFATVFAPGRFKEVREDARGRRCPC